MPRARIIGTLLYPPSGQRRKLTTSLISNRLTSRCTVITGSSSGLGRAIALAFAANGASPIVCSDLRPDPHGDFGVEEAGVPTHQLICRRYGEGKAHFVQADATVGMEVEQVVKKAVEVGGRLDVIVNNVGIPGTGTAAKFHEMSEETWDFVMKVNSKSIFLGCKHAINQFLSQSLHPSGHRGWIINTASVAGLVGLRFNAGAYCASKGAIVLLTKQLAVEYGPDKIHCNALCPGFLKTPMTAQVHENKEMRDALNAMIPLGDWGLADDVAKGAVFLASDDAAYVTGIPLAIDGGYTAH